MKVKMGQGTYYCGCGATMKKVTHKRLVCKRGHIFNRKTQEYMTKK